MVSYISYKIGEALSLSLPLKAAYSLAVFLSNLRYFFAAKDRKIVTENLKAIFPEKDEREIAGIRLRLFHNFAKYLVDFLRFKNLDMEYIRNKVKIVNLDGLDGEIKKGKGVILVTAHLGNWELGGVVLSMVGYPISTVALSHKSKVVTDFFNAQRENKGLKVFILGDAAKGCIRSLKGGQLLALVGDRDFTDGGRVTPFFGRPSLLPEGPAVLSLHTSSPIIPGFMLRKEDDSFELILEKPLNYAPTGDKSKDLDNLISEYKSIFEKYIRSYPDQWYMFRRFWK